MAVVKNRIQEIFTVNRVPPDLLDLWTLPFFKDHAIKEFIAFLHTDIFSYHIIDVVIWVQDLHLNVEQAGLAFDPDEIPGLLVKQFAIDINLHV